MTTIINEVKAILLALMNSNELNADSQYIIYGMKIYDSTIDSSISISYNFLEELIGTRKINLEENRNRVVACCVDMAAVRIYATLGGVSIPTHFNYKDYDLTITKNVTPMIEQGLKLHLMSAKQWFKILLSDTWAAVSKQDDLMFVSPIYNVNYGCDYISHDTPLN